MDIVNFIVLFIFAVCFGVSYVVLSWLFSVSFSLLLVLFSVIFGTALTGIVVFLLSMYLMRNIKY